MTKHALTPAEFRQLAVAVAALPFLPCQRASTDYVQEVLETVLNFHIQAVVVANALRYFREQVQPQYAIDDHARLRERLMAFPETPEGLRAASQFFWNNGHWTRIALLRPLLTFLEGIGVTDLASLHAWAQRATFKADFQGQVKGLGLAVFQWLRLRCGVDTLKPDVWVLSFAQRVLGRPVSASVLVDAFHRLAPLVGETLPTIDRTLWHYEKLGMATHDAPGLRLIAWQQLKVGFERALHGSPGAVGQGGTPYPPVEHPPFGFTWNILLDDKARLRDAPAGLTLIPDRAGFAPSPGHTTLRLQQAPWHAGWWLTLDVAHSQSLPVPVFQALQARLADADGDWEAGNTPTLTLRLALDASMALDPAMTLEELAAWVGDIVAVVLAGLALVWEEGGSETVEQEDEKAKALS